MFDSITIEQKHIDQGVSGNCYLCPIALALLSNGAEEVSINSTRGRYKIEGDVFWFHMPWSLRVFVWNFDRGIAVNTGTFKIETYLETNGEGIK